MTDFNERFSYELTQDSVYVYDRDYKTTHYLPLQMLNQIVKKAKALQKVRTI